MRVGSHGLGEELTRSQVTSLHVAQGDPAIVLKRFDPQAGLDPALVQPLRGEFVRRAEGLARLRHPHLVQVVEQGLEGARPWYAMRRVPGARRLDQLFGAGTLEPRAVARLVELLAGGVAHAHAQGLVHGLIGPERVLVGSDLRPVLIGFGRGVRALAARARGDHLAWLELLLGAAPELLGGLAPEPGSDVYGLGLLLYQALCGRSPHHSNAPVDARQRLTCLPPPPSRFSAHVEPALEAIAMRCLQLTPGARFPSAAALAEALADWRGREGERVGPYRLEAELGRGGMSRVWRAQDEAGRPVALKVRAAEANQRRFEREVDLHGRLAHPHVVALLGHGEHEGRQYMALELIEGTTLEQLARRQRLAPERVAAVLAQVARALHHAHQRGVVHRDVKPGNVLVRTCDGRAFLADFGLAKPLHAGSRQALTRRYTMVGTPAFAAPEQLVDGAPVGPAADLFGLGLTLWAALTGRPPFERASLGATVQATLHDPLPSLKALRPDVPPALEAICRRCLTRDPGQRHADAEALARDLEAVASPTSRPTARLQARPLDPGRASPEDAWSFELDPAEAPTRAHGSDARAGGARSGGPALNAADGSS